MRNYLLVSIFILLVSQMRAQSAGCSDCGALAFKENKNQWDSRILFETEFHNGSLFLCKTNLTFVLEDSADMNRMRRSHHPHLYKPDMDLTIHGHVFRENFLNANADCKIAGNEKQKEYYNFYIGKDPKRWASRVGGYRHVVYQNVYNNIDLDVASVSVSVKYDFVVKPGGNSEDVLINYEGLDGIAMLNGDLILKTSVGKVVDTKPYAYQVVNGQKQQVACNFKLSGNNVSFVFPDGYNKTADLIIDPILIFSTFSGSTTDNFGYSATYDSKGNAYAAGTAFFLSGYSYPVTPGAFQTTWAGGIGFGQTGLDGTGTDISITKYDSAGTVRIYSTYLGGNHDELPHSLIVNSNDELFVLGTTASSNFPVTHGAFDTTYNGGFDPGIFYGIGVHYSTGCDMFVTRFNSSGTALLGSTYLGGSDNDGLTYPEYASLNYNYADEVRGEINIDKNDNVYIASCTRSANFPVTAGALQTTFAGGTDGVVVKMNSGLSAIIWSTFLGGNDEDAIYSIDFDPNGDLYVAGGTISNNFPNTPGSLQTTNRGGRAEGFIAHLSQNGNALLQSTFYGTPEYDQVYFVRTDVAGYPYVFGQTEDTTGRFIFNAAFSNPKSGQFISKLSQKLDTIIWSTTFGSGRGQPDISPTAFLVDVCSKTYISGWGSNFFADYNIAGAPPLSTQGLQVTPNAIQPTTDNQDFYVMVMKDDASAISFATYFGSNGDEEHVDGGTSRFDRKGVIYQSVCAGCNGMSTFPTTPGVVSNTNNSPNCNNAVFKMDLQLPIVVAAFSVPTTVCIPDTLSFINSSKTVVSPTFTWTFGDGTASNATNPTHIYTQGGIYTVQLVVTDPGSCNFSDTLRKRIIVLSTGKTDTIAPVSICPGTRGQIGLPPGYDSLVTYLWIPATHLSQSNVPNPFANPPINTNYELLVSNGVCTDTFKQTVLVDANTLTIAGDTLTCQGDTLTLVATNSTPDQYTFNWQPVSPILTGSGTSTIVVLPMQTTTFNLTVTSSAGCIFKDSLHIKVGNVAQITAAFNSPIPGCIPDTVQFNNLSQAPPNATYQWDFGDGNTGTGPTPSHVYTQTGVYTVSLIVSYGTTCRAEDSVKHQVVAITNTSSDTLPTFTLCAGQSKQIGVNSGQDSLVSYTWIPSTYLNQSNIPNPIATPSQSTTYQLVISSGACTDTFTQKLLVDTNALRLLAGNVVCANDTLTIHASSTEPGEQLTYVWQPVSQIVSGDSTANPVVRPSQTTTFTLTTVNQLGCVLKDSIVVNVTSVLPSVHAFAIPDTIIYGDTTQLNLTLSANVVAVDWQPDTSIIGSLNIANPLADPKVTNTYFVQVRDSESCIKLDTVIVYVRHTPCAETNIYVPNAFSPNGDGKNDVLYVRANAITNIYFTVFDRWGQKMFETTDITKGWDGTFKGKKMDDAVFGYYVKGQCLTGDHFEKKGNVTLLR